MKKLVSMMLAVLLACLLPLAGMAEKTGLPDLTGRWSDTVQAPSAQELADGYFRAVAAAEDGTAGAGLKRAKAVYDVYSFCFENALWLVDTDELGKNMLAARELLSKEELAAFDANEPAVTAEALRLLKEEENLDGDYHDAGVAGTMEVLREDPAVRSSVSFFLACVITLENIGEP